jgi:hypothetical protein
VDNPVNKSLSKRLEASIGGRIDHIAYFLGIDRSGHTPLFVVV